MSMKLAVCDFEKLRCCKCNNLLSVPPVTFAPSGGFCCGRCQSEGAVNVVYEILAENFQFPCRYESNGCKEKHFFNLMKTHETLCSKRPHLCPILPVGRCLWRGVSDDILHHLKTEHRKCITDAKVLELNLSKNVESCTVFVEDGVCFLIRLVYNKAKGLMVNVLEVGINFRNFNQYEIHLHSHDFTKTVKLATRYILHYTSNHKLDQKLIDSNVLSFATNETIYVEIVFVQPATKLDRFALALLECPVCTEIMTCAIYQCKTGHSFCGSCTKKLARCPICQQELTNTLNYALMAHSAQVTHACKNKKVGCTYAATQAQLRRHENACFRYDCPLKSAKTCRFNGNRKELLEHCTYFHEKESGDVKWSLKTVNATRTKIICAFGNVFKSSRKFTGNELLWSVEFCGRDEEAKEFCYTVEFELGARKLVFGDVCRGVGEESAVFDACVSVPYYQFAPLVSNGVCRNNVYVNKTKDL